MSSSEKRKRSIYITTAIAIVISAVLLFVFFRKGKQQGYVPGELIEGITGENSKPIPKDYPRITFTDVNNLANVHFKHFFGERTTQLPEDMGSGAAWIDYDQDGYDDLFIVNEAGPLTMTAGEIKQSPARCALYHNNGDGTFIDVTKKSGIDFRGCGMGVAAADADNDDFPDIFITSYGKNVFYHNNGDGTFTDKSKKSRLGEIDGFWEGASWADYDKDGFLDLYVCGYVKYDQLNKNPTARRDNSEEPPDIECLEQRSS